MKNIRIFLPALTALLLVSLVSLGQTRLMAQPPGRPAPSVADTLQTVEVGADNRVTFRFFAPKATTVTVGGDFTLGGPAGVLTKTDDGVWSWTTPNPIPPDSYTYNFTVDGVGVLDQRAANFRDNPNSLFNWFDMPGADTDFMALKDVPHGQIVKVIYHSSTFNQERSMHVYLPPNMQSIKGKLPVLYLLHGYGDNDISWVSAGKVPLILDNLYAAGKLKNMIVVMPNGTIPAGGRGGIFHIGTDDDPFAQDFLHDLMPYVEKTYPVSTKREDRAIAGFSMGGVQALNLALWHPDMFAYLFPISTGFFPQGAKEIEEKDSAVLKNIADHPFKQLVIGCGKQDTVMGNNSKATRELFDRAGIKYQFIELEGGHSFTFSRRFLLAAFPLLFK